jgi:hypothetical protein
MPFEEIRPQLGERPAPEGQADLGRRSFRQAADLGDLACRDPCRSAGAGWLLHGRNTLLLEGVEIGIDGVAVNSQQAGDCLSIESRRVEQNGLRTSALSGLQRPFQQAVDLPQLEGPRLGNRQGPRHG